jgi:hypothetical protein
MLESGIDRCKRWIFWAAWTCHSGRDAIPCGFLVFPREISDLKPGQSSRRHRVCTGAFQRGRLSADAPPFPVPSGSVERLGAVADVVEKWGGVVSDLFNESGPAFERRRRPRHG